MRQRESTDVRGGVRQEVVAGLNAYGAIPATPDSGRARPPGPARRSGIGLSAGLILLFVALIVAPYSLLLPKVEASGAVIDDWSDQPIAGARISAPASSLTSDGDGRFATGRVSLTDWLDVDAEGYLPAQVPVWPPRRIRVDLVPRTFDLMVRDAETGGPVPGVAVAADPARAQPLEPPGEFRIGPARPDTLVTIKAASYLDVTLPYNGDAAMVARLQPRLAGRVIDAQSGKPIPSAFLGFEDGTATADRDGTFELRARPTGPVKVLAPGYRRADVDLGQDRSLEIRLEPLVVKGVYLTHYGIADRGLRGNALELTDKSEVNALVIDVKGDRGWMSYRSAVPLADAIGANQETTIADVAELLAQLKRRNVYTIARIVVMKDDMLARNGRRAGLDVAIKDARTGEPWIDGEDLGWVDPFRHEVWEYNIALAREAAQKGFDEIQFDYIRFPTDPSRGTNVGAATYSRVLTEESRVEAITTFLRRARDEVRSAGAYLGVDVFGYVTLNSGDIGIGQQLEAVAEVVDYVCPMVYPSAYTAGLPAGISFPQVVARPYDVVYDSMRRARERAEGRGAVMRPWLQYFDDYPWATRRAYNAAEINAQKKGAAEAGSVGWMMWDPHNKYARGGFAPKN